MHDHYGIRGQANKIMQAFLNQKQYVLVNDIKSNLHTNKHGAAQGSTLGPLLFLLYINDLPYSINCKPRFFANETRLVYSSPTLSMLNTAINQDPKKYFDLVKTQYTYIKSLQI